MKRYSYIEMSRKDFNKALKKPLREGKFNRKMTDFDPEEITEKFFREGILPVFMFIQDNYCAYSYTDYTNRAPVVPDRVLVLRDNKLTPLWF